MSRYFSCHKKQKVIKPEFVAGTPVEILSPLYIHLQPLPKERDKLEALDYELIEQIHLLQAEYNKRFQDAKHCIAKNDMARGLHYMNRSNEVKKRITELEKRHHDILNAIEEIVLRHPAIPRPLPRTPMCKTPRSSSYESPPTLK